MPSPIAHVAMGYLVYRTFRSRTPEEASQRLGPLPRDLVATMAMSLAPDLDAVPGILFRDLGRFHNNFMNSIIFGLAFALGVGAVSWINKRSGFKRWFTIALVSYETHVLMDFFTPGRGLLLLWPFSSERFAPPFKLFYGFRWSQGLISPKHIVTLVTELGTIGFVGLIIYFLNRRKPIKD